MCAPSPSVRAPAVSHVEIETRGWSGTLELHLPGRFNVANALAALGVAAAIGLELPAAAAALSGVQGVPGRMQRIDEGQPFGVVVDYAHTAEALAKVLDELAPASPAGLVAVFGSAGERDTAKRAAMGRVAGERCRLVIATDEDPRGEDRRAILEAIAAGAEAAGRRRGEVSPAHPGPGGCHRHRDAPGTSRRDRPAGWQGPRAHHRDARRRHRLG